MSNTNEISRRQMLTGMGVAAGGALAVGGVAGGLIGHKVGEEGDGGSGASKGSDKGPLKIGSPYPLSGPFAADGEQMVNGTKLAIDEINKAGGVGGRKIEHMVLDTTVNSPESVAASLNKLINARVDAIVGGYLQVDKPAYDVIPAYGCPYLHGNTTQAGVDLVADDPKKYSMFFNVDATEVWYGKSLPTFVDHLEQIDAWKPGGKTMVIVEGDLVYSQIISKAAKEAGEKAGWKVTDTIKVVTPVNDWGPVLRKIRASRPAIIFNAHPAPADQAAFMKQFVADPTDSLVYLQYGPSIPQFLQLAGKSAEGVIWSTVVGNVGGKLGNKFTEDYKKAFNKPAGLANAPQGYDTIYMLANAWGMVGDSRDFEAVCTQIRMQRYRGVCGSFYMNQPGQYSAPYPAAEKDPSLGIPHLYLQVQGNDHKVVYPDPYGVAEFKQPPWMKAA